MSKIEVNTVVPKTGTTVTIGEAGQTVDVAGNLSASQGAIQNSALQNSGITLNGVVVQLGGSATIPTEVTPTVSSLSPLIVLPSTPTAITITGTNFESTPLVSAQNTSTGLITVATAVTFTSSTSISATLSLVAGTYKLYIENPDGNAVLTSQTLTISEGPAWTTNAGSLGTFEAGGTISGLNVVASSDTNVTITEITSPLTLTGNTDTPASTMNLTLSGTPATTATYTISGTAPSPTAETTYNFTLRATDAEGQETDRAFSITISVEITEGMMFN